MTPHFTDPDGHSTLFVTITDDGLVQINAEADYDFGDHVSVRLDPDRAHELANHIIRRANVLSGTYSLWKQVARHVQHRIDTGERPA